MHHPDLVFLTRGACLFEIALFLQCDQVLWALKILSPVFTGQQYERISKRLYKTLIINVLCRDRACPVRKR